MRDNVVVTRMIKNIKEWEKYTKNQKYCDHMLGFWDKNMKGILYCITCGKEMNNLAFDLGVASR